MKQSRHVYLLISLFLLSGPDCIAQMSKVLFEQLPDSIRPKDRNNLQLAEVNNLLSHWYEYSNWTDVQHAEADKICYDNADKYQTLKDVDKQSEFLHTLCRYLYFSIGRAQELDESLIQNGKILPPHQAKIGLMYSDTFLLKIAQKPLKHKYFIPNIYLYKAHFLMAMERHKDAYYTLLESKNVAQKAKMPTSVSAVFGSMAFLAETLGLPKLAIKNYDQSYASIKDEPVTNKWVEGQRMYILYGKLRTYFAQYIKENDPALADSVQKLHNKIISMERQYNGGMEAESHLAMAGINYYRGRYSLSIAHVDSAYKIYPDLKSFGISENAIAYKALSLIRLGNTKLGKSMITDINFSKVNNPIIGRILEDLYSLEQSDGNFKKASVYQQILIGHLKWKATLDLRGKSLEMEQFYRVREQETQIKNMESLHNRNTYIGILIVIILLIVSAIIYYRYRLGTKNGRKLINQVEKMTESHSLQIMEAKNIERKKLAQDLHDDLSASLAANMNYLRLRSIQASTETERQNSLALLNMIKESYERVREKSHNMYWEEPTESFIKRIDQMVDILFFGTDIKISLVSDIANFELNAETKETILLIIKESITNIIRHASATEAEITFYTEPECLILEIVDNGKGVKKSKSSKSLGLESLQKRIKEINGILTISSNRPSGTIISCNFPLALSGEFKNRADFISEKF